MEIGLAHNVLCTFCERFLKINNFSKHLCFLIHKNAGIMLIKRTDYTRARGGLEAKWVRNIRFLS